MKYQQFQQTIHTGGTMNLKSVINGISPSLWDDIVRRICEKIVSSQEAEEATLQKFPWKGVNWYAPAGDPTSPVGFFEDIGLLYDPPEFPARDVVECLKKNHPSFWVMFSSQKLAELTAERMVNSW